MSYENRGYRSRQEGIFYIFVLLHVFTFIIGGRYRQSGGGGGGGGAYRRRGKIDFFFLKINILTCLLDERKGYSNRRPYDRPPESRRSDDLEDIEIKLKGLIIKIGDKVFTLHYKIY